MTGRRSGAAGGDDQVRATPVRSKNSEVGAVQVRVLEVGAVEVRVPEVGPLELHPPEVDPGEIERPTAARRKLTAAKHRHRCLDVGWRALGFCTVRARLALLRVPGGGLGGPSLGRPLPLDDGDQPLGDRLQGGWRWRRWRWPGGVVADIGG